MKKNPCNADIKLPQTECAAPAKMTKAQRKAAEDAIKAEKAQADHEAKERARKYPCTGGAEILTARPEGMPYEKYRELRATQNRQIKQYLKRGRLIYKAAEIYIVKGDNTELPYTQENANNGVTMRRTWPPYRRPKLLTKTAVDAALQRVKEVQIANA